MRIAVMQPYFLPYIGYFGLFAHTDLVVFFDCVQFPERGWVHRNRFYTANQQLSWFTLPVIKETRFQLIDDLRFTVDAKDTLASQKNRFPIFNSKSISELCDIILSPNADVKSYLVQTLKWCCDYMAIPFNTTFSSDYKLPDSLRGEERIMALCKELGAKDYINLPGGRSLYNEDRFKKENITLSFLPPLAGDHSSIIELLDKHSTSKLRELIYAQLPVPC
jgi:hypothetical protein